jgi:hypothetical protein
LKNVDELVVNLTHLMNHKDKIPEEGFIELMGKILGINPSLGWELGLSPENVDIDVLSISTGDDDNEFYEIRDMDIFPIYGGGWQIVLGVPPRNWEMFFFISSDANEEFEIDASNWLYAATWTNNYVDIEISGPRQDLIDNGIIDDALRVVLNGEIGELNLRTFIRSFKIFDGHIDERFKSIKSLRNDFSSHFDNCFYRTFLAS